MGGGSRVAWAAALGLAAWAGAAEAQAAGAGDEGAPVTTRRLLAEMTDLAAMAEFPSPPYTCRQFSSYDRASRSPAEPGWFANGDRGHFLRVETRAGRKEFVLMDAAGPGAIVRIWSANPAGTLRVYLDGAETPALEAPMADLLGGRYPGLPPPISAEAAKGSNLYFPIPYERGCKVTSDRGGSYYHVNYRTYAAGTSVASFAPGEIAALAPEIGRLASRLAAPGGLDPVPPGLEARPFAVSLAPGSSAPLGSLEGPKAIRRFRLRWTPSDDRDEPALRSTVLRMTFDGETTVEAPLGDFFGSGPGVNPYESLPSSVAADGRMESRWVMPFRTAATIEVRNMGRSAVRLEGEIAAAPYAPTDRTMLFHAKWRIEHDVATVPKRDWNYLRVRGRGVFAGAAFAIDNPVLAWWGEGDEKIYADGETFPSHFGTGTEDYFGYAWCHPGLFAHAYHAQTRCDGPANFGRTSVNRWHILDRIPFTRDFHFDMEIWHWAACKVNLAVIDYWYAIPGATDSFRPIAAEDVALRPMDAAAVPKVAGAIEGEAMRIIAATGTPGPQDLDGTSGGRHLWWHGGEKPGDTLVLGFPVAEAGTYGVAGRFLKAPDYGIARLAINGAPAGGPLDFYAPEVAVGDEVDLGTFDLPAGENRLSVTIAGANPRALKRYMVGIDYLRLKPLR